MLRRPMWTFLLDPATQGVALAVALCVLGWIAFDLVQDVRAPSPTDPLRSRTARAAPAARPVRPAVGPAVEVWTDASGKVRGTIRRGPCAGQRVEDLDAADCQRQAAYLRAHDPAYAASWEDYIRARFAAPPPQREDGAMTRPQALRELGLAEGASATRIHAAWVTLIKRHHPDHGGTQAKAARINAAKDMLSD